MAARTLVRVEDLRPGELRTASFGLRCGAWALDYVISAFTFGIGWFIWLLFVARHGQSPGKQILGLVVLRCDGLQAGWGRTMVREIVLKQLVPSAFLLLAVVLAPVSSVALLLILGSPVAFLVGALWMLGDDRGQALWDKGSDSLVACRDDRPAVLRAGP